MGNSKLQGGDPSFKKWQYVTFSVSDLAYSLLYFWVVAFLTIYYTDVFKISAAVVSVMMLVVRVYDAVIDPFIGGLMDNNKSRMGRFRPWIIVGGVGMVVTTILMFWAHPDWSNTGKIVYMYLTYILCCTAMSIFYMAYGALGGTISANSMVRARANSFRFGFQGAGNLAIGYFVPALLAAFGAVSLARGYFLGVLLCGVIALPIILVTGLGTKEVVYPPEDAKPSYKDQFKALLTNKPMIVIALLFLLQGASFTFRMTASTYYFTYVAGDLSYFSVYSLLISILSIIGALSAPYVYKLFKDKAKALGVILIITALVLAGMRFFPAPGTLFFVLAALSGYSNGAIPALSYSMLPEAVDYTHFKDGLRTDAFMAAVGSFTFQCGMALSGAAVGFVLSAVGYVANAPQTDTALGSISDMMTLVPSVLVAVMAVLMFFYPLNEKKHDEILVGLREKNLI